MIYFWRKKRRNGSTKKAEKSLAWLATSLLICSSVIGFMLFFVDFRSSAEWRVLSILMYLCVCVLARKKSRCVYSLMLDSHIMSFSMCIKMALSGALLTYTYIHKLQLFYGQKIFLVWSCFTYIYIRSFPGILEQLKIFLAFGTWLNLHVCFILFLSFIFSLVGVRLGIGSYVPIAITVCPQNCVPNTVIYLEIGTAGDEILDQLALRLASLGEHV